MIPLFSCVCAEPEGTVTRTVYQAEFSIEFFLKLWEKQKKYRTLMGKEILYFEQFLNFFVNSHKDGTMEPRGLCFVIDDCVGIYWLSNIDWPDGAEVHYTFFDGRHKGRLEITKKAIQYVFDTYNFQRLYVRVAVYAKYPLKFVEALGFKKEGRLRRCVRLHDKLYDANAYSILREEMNDYWKWGE